MFNESLKDPNFRKECEDATAKLAELDRTNAARCEPGLRAAGVAACMSATQSAEDRLLATLLSVS